MARLAKDAIVHYHPLDLNQEIHYTAQGIRVRLTWEKGTLSSLLLSWKEVDRYRADITGDPGAVGRTEAGEGTPCVQEGSSDEEN